MLRCQQSRSRLGQLYIICCTQQDECLSDLLGQEVDSNGVFVSVCPQLNLSQNLWGVRASQPTEPPSAAALRTRHLAVPDW